MASRNVKPGQSVPTSGQYVQQGPRGGAAGKTESTLVSGNPAPPTSKPGNTWHLVDKTKHKS